MQSFEAFNNNTIYFLFAKKLTDIFSVDFKLSLVNIFDSSLYQNSSLVELFVILKLLMFSYFWFEKIF